MRVAALLLVIPLLPALAQEKTTPTIYKVEYRIRDGSDAGKAGRRYSMLIENHGKGVFKVGDRVPVATGSFQPGVGGVGANPLVNTQFTYLDIGVNIETSLNEQDGRIALSANLDMSTLVEHKQAQPSQVLPNPTVSQIRIVISATVPLGKPTLVASIDDPVTQRKFDVEATVTKAE